MGGTMGKEWRRCSRGTGSRPGKGLPLPALGLKLPGPGTLFLNATSLHETDITRYAQLDHCPDLAGKGCHQRKGLGFGVL